MKKGIIVLITCLTVSIFVMYVSSIKQAVFINIKPSIMMEDTEYIVTMEITGRDKLDKQVGKVNQIVQAVSYIEKENPYKKPGRIYKIRGKNIKDEVALEMNGNLYIARLIGFK